MVYCEIKRLVLSLWRSAREGDARNEGKGLEMKQDTSRREFLKGTAWIGAVAMASGCMSGGLKATGATGAPMQGFAMKPIKKVRVACVGVGARGIGAVHRIAMIPGTEIVAICDLFQDRVDKQLKWLKDSGKPAAKGLVGPDSYRRACEMDDVDVVYSVTPWHIHADVAACAMEHGKVALTEVPGCLTIDECWRLVETSERTRMPCMMLENCCYGEYEMLCFNLIKQGLLGELVHGEAGYIHDQRSLQYNSRYHSISGHAVASDHGEPGWALDIYSKHSGNYYPTHGLGPIAKDMDINHGDNFDFLVSLDSKQANYHRYGREMYTDWRKDYKVKMGDMNLSLIKTKLGRSILLEHDVASPRPYSRLNLISGTKGVFHSYPDLSRVPGALDSAPSYFVTFESKCGDAATHAYFDKKRAEEIRQRYKHPFWKVVGEVARKVGGHGGMDFIMDLRWSYCLQNGLPLDTDVYDLAAWSAMVELTERSVDANSRPIDCPDFTRGAWRTARPFTVDEIDLAKLPGDFGGAKKDEQAEKNAKQEGLS